MPKTVTSNTDPQVQQLILNIKTNAANLYTGVIGGTISTDKQIYGYLDGIEQDLSRCKGFLQAHAGN